MAHEKSDIIVSVVIPVYNAEEYIADTLKNIVSQSLYEIEIIIINDHSSDNTLDILKEIASSDERIRIIDNAVNIGAGISRNIGLSEAEGEYIIFLDDDDYVDTNMLKHMSDFAELSGADIVVCRSRSFNLQSLQCQIQFEKIYYLKKQFSRLEILSETFSGHLYGGHGTNYSDVNLLFSTR
ncbi:hypothetical protein AE28_02417 [Klebsiella pneumoniae BIDMC 54]|nr:hypothetical protein AE28_02417 [Klebsiella pneumoniae BIDMC 54]